MHASVASSPRVPHSYDYLQPGPRRGVLAHFPDPEAWAVINAEEFDALLIEDDFVRDVFCYQRAFIHDHKQPASATVLGDEFDMDLREPETAIGDLLDRLRTRFVKNQGRDALRDIIELQTKEPLVLPSVLLKKGRELSGLLTRRGGCSPPATWIVHSIAFRRRWPPVPAPALASQI